MSRFDSLTKPDFLKRKRKWGSLGDSVKENFIIVVSNFYWIESSENEVWFRRKESIDY